jgi:flagellar protein FliS
MFSSRTPTDAYRKVGLETQLESATPYKLVLMLYEGAMISVTDAQRHMEAKAVPEKGKAISQAIDIIANGLQASLDTQAGGEIADRLDALYEYMGRRLLYANLKNDVGALKEVWSLLNELRTAWEQIADDPAVVSRNSQP